MFSATSSLGPRRAAMRGTLVIALLLGCPLGGMAGEATKRGRNADVRWVAPDGTTHEVAGREIRYVHYERTYLSVPKKGKTFKDRTRENKGIPTGRGFIAFGNLERIDFLWPETDTDPLLLRIVKVGGEIVEVRGSEMAGADHPTPPYVEFHTADGRMKFVLYPLGPLERRMGEPLLESLDFSL